MRVSTFYEPQSFFHLLSSFTSLFIWIEYYGDIKSQRLILCSLLKSVLRSIPSENLRFMSCVSTWDLLWQSLLSKETFQIHPTKNPKSVLSAELGERDENQQSRRWKINHNMNEHTASEKNIRMQCTNYTTIHNTYHFVEIIAMILLFTTWTNIVRMRFFRLFISFLFFSVIYFGFENVMFKLHEYVV